MLYAIVEERNAVRELRAEPTGVRFVKRFLRFPEIARNGGAETPIHRFVYHPKVGWLIPNFKCFDPLANLLHCIPECTCR